MSKLTNMQSSNTMYDISFDNAFKLKENTKYLIEFVTKNGETGEINSSRARVNLSFTNETSSNFGVITGVNRGDWSTNWLGTYKASVKFSLKNIHTNCPLTFVAKSNGEDASNIILLNPFVTASTDLKIDTVVNGHVMGIVLEKNENTVAGEHYLGIKTLYINKDTNEMKELLLHSPLTIIE
jgi:hypothetical protein